MSYDKDIEILRREIGILAEANHKLQDKLNIAIEGLKALISDGIQSGIAKDTLEEIKKVNQKKYWIEKENYRANHLFGIKQLDNKINLIEKLKSKKISVSIRGDKIRVSPHVYNDKREIKKLFECLT